MNTRREFFQNSLLSFGILPLLNKFNFSNNDFLPRWDVAAKVVESFILNMDYENIKKRNSRINSIDICYDNMVPDDKIGIYGIGFEKNNNIWVAISTKTQIDWLKKYNVSSSTIINALSDYYLKNGFSKSEPIIGSNNYGSSQWGVRVFKENN